MFDPCFRFARPLRETAVVGTFFALSARSQVVGGEKCLLAGSAVERVAVVVRAREGFFFFFFYIVCRYEDGEAPFFPRSRRTLLTALSVGVC